MTNDAYYLGLDIGTDSVGWAVTNQNYQLMKKNGKALWGIRLFDNAKTAEERHGYRVARRRIERRKHRIQWLQETFSSEIAKVDPGFFQRLHESKFLEEDKCSCIPLSKYALFADKNYCDIDYYKQFPTIYHLRKALIESKEPLDVRLVYLGIHHIMKNRGHFLYGDLPLNTITLDSGLARLSHAISVEYDREITLKNTEQLREILLANTENKTWRKKNLADLLSISKTDGPCYKVVELLSGSKVSLDALFGEGTANDELSKISMEDDFAALEDKLLAILGDRIELVLAVKEVYDWARLETMRGGEPYLSFAKVKTYEKHCEDLKRLKRAVKILNNPELYREIFHHSRDKLNNYVAYSGKDANNHRCTAEEFQKYLLGKLRPWKDCPEIGRILNELEAGTFLPKQTSKDNGIIPHQLHETELVQILDNASQYLPFLLEKDDSGLSKAEQIHKMFCFQIPYYVGPLDSRSTHGWIVRKPDKIFPWNFSQVVDLEECRKNFIMRMTAKCSYIGEDVLPKDSLLYSKFMVLNELNKLKINGEGISVEQKQNIYQELFLTGTKISQAKIRTYLQLDKSDELTGFDQEIKATLAPWKHFDWLIRRPGGMEAAEEIIRHITLFGKDHKLLQGWLQKTYGTLLTPEEQKKALRFTCNGWGKLSRIFLTELYHVDPDTGELFSILDMLWNTNNNLMELLSGRYTFGQAVAAYREKTFSKQGSTLQEYLDESYASPAIKRSIHQVIHIASELQGILQSPPKRIFIEMAREKEKKKNRTVSRKAELLALYEKCTDECRSLFEQLSDEPEGNLRRDKLYLYYTQMGKCMYSGDPIDLSKLDSDYDIDHIYPQSKIKDDSLRNRVLVKRQLNAAKTDQYPLPAEMRKKMRPFWSMLEKKGMLSKEKFERLIRATPFTLEEQADFIARQLVETQQSCKIVAELLQRRFGEQTEIVYVKAGNVSAFRQEQKITEDGRQIQGSLCKNLHTQQDPLFVKCREINDLHHAKDAYLNIVVGNVYHVKFTRNPANYLKQSNFKYSLNRMFDFNVERNGETAWVSGETGSIATVRRMMRKNNILFTRRAAEVKGGLFDQLLVSQGKGQTPVKSSDPRLATGYYGEYNKRTGTYFILVEHTEKKKRVRSLEAIYLMHKAIYEQDPLRYCREILGLQEPVILIPKIKINALVSLDGFRMHISGRSGDSILLKNANPLILDLPWQEYTKKISKYLERCKAAGRDLEIATQDGLEEEKNQQFYTVLVEKLENPLYRIKYATPAKTLRENEEKFQNLSCGDQCKVLIQILHLFANNATSADLKLLNGKSGIGILKIPKKLAARQGKSFLLIHQSVTGFFEQTVDLLSGEVQ